MVSDKYRMHRLRAGDEWAIGTLAKGNARFGDNEDRPWVAPLSNDEASEFVSDPRTVCVVAIDMDTNNMAGFAYGGVLYRRHTRLRHLCLYEIGIDVDHRNAGVDKLLLQAVGAEARQMGIEQGFALPPPPTRAPRSCSSRSAPCAATTTRSSMASSSNSCPSGISCPSSSKSVARLRRPLTVPSK